MRIGRLVIAIVTLTPPKAPPLPPVQGPELEDVTVTAVPRVIDGRAAYERRRIVALLEGELSIDDLLRKVTAGKAIKARLLRHFNNRTAPIRRAQRARIALLGQHDPFRRSA